MVAALFFGEALAINKCTQKDGKVVYQDAACETTARGEAVRVFAGEGTPAVPPAAVTTATPPKPERRERQQERDSGAASIGPTSASASGIERLAAACLDWYRPRLKNPAGAYQADASMEKGVLTMTIYASNSFGGYVPKVAACEFKGESLDASWTRIQAQRAGWN